MSSPQAAWDGLDPHARPTYAWLREVDGPVAVLLGAFDPPTRAHLAVVGAAAAATGRAGVLCLTKVLLDRPADVLLVAAERLALLTQLGDEEDLGVAAANRGTYLEVARAAAAAGVDAVFVVGADKLPQLRGPAFYPDGRAGVDATFREVSFVVVRRSGAPVADLPPDAVVIEPSDVFDDAVTSAISATEVRRRVRAGEDVTDAVPPVVAARLAGYTGPSEPR